MNNSHGNNGRDNLPLFRANRERKVFRIHGDKQKVKNILERGRRRMGAFTQTNRRKFNEWWYYLRTKVNAWDGVGIFLEPIPADLVEHLTSDAESDLTRELKELCSNKTIFINKTDLRVEIQ